MFSAFLFRVDLRRLILLLATFSAIVTLVNGFYASYAVQRQQLIDSALESNRAYAQKLADSVDDFLRAAQQQLAYSAGVVGQRFDQGGCCWPKSIVCACKRTPSTPWSWSMPKAGCGPLHPRPCKSRGGAWIRQVLSRPCVRSVRWSASRMSR